MDRCLMVGCDLHDDTMLLKVAVDRNKPEQLVFANTGPRREAMIKELKRRAKAAGARRIVFAYEASCQGYGLYDELRDEGIECHVLAPTKIPRSPKHKRSKTDERDAQRILEILRAHVLAGNELPTVWVPDAKTRDDRDLVRGRLGVKQNAAAVKAQIRMLVKRYRVSKPAQVGDTWSGSHRAWLRGLRWVGGSLGRGARAQLCSLLRQLDFLEREVARLDKAVAKLAEDERYAEPVKVLCEETGVAVLAAMVFLTEVGDMARFQNRGQIGAYLGLAPSSNESGKRDDRKGHITRQGPARVRKVLCQAVWCRLRHDAETQAAHARIAGGKRSRRKVATVALMRQLAVRLWHLALEAQRRAGCFPKPADGDAA